MTRMVTDGTQCVKVTNFKGTFIDGGGRSSTVKLHLCYCCTSLNKVTRDNRRQSTCLNLVVEVMGSVKH